MSADGPFKQVKVKSKMTKQQIQNSPNRAWLLSWKKLKNTKHYNYKHFMNTSKITLQRLMGAEEISQRMEQH